MAFWDLWLFPCIFCVDYCHVFKSSRGNIELTLPLSFPQAKSRNKCKVKDLQSPLDLILFQMTEIMTYIDLS